MKDVILSVDACDFMELMRAYSNLSHNDRWISEKGFSTTCDKSIFTKHSSNAVELLNYWGTEPKILLDTLYIDEYMVFIEGVLLKTDGTLPAYGSIPTITVPLAVMHPDDEKEKKSRGLGVSLITHKFSLKHCGIERELRCEFSMKKKR